MAKFQDFLSRIGSNRDRAALRGIFSMFLTDDNPPQLKDLTLASIVLSGTETTQVTISGASTTGILQSGTSTTAYSITGAFTTGISIAADGTTAIAVTSAFTGVTGISIAGTASGDGILISGVCADAIHISGANTASGLHISGDQVVGTLFEATAAADAAHRVTIPTGITLGAGLDINATSTGTVTSGLTMQGTGTFTAGITLSATAITTGILLSAGSMTDAISITGTTPVDGIHISSACSGVAVNISGANATGLSISGANTVAAMAIGTSGAKLALVSGLPTVTMFTTSSDTTGNIRAVEIDSTYTGASATNSIENFASIVTANVQTGNWCNAILWKIDYSSAGYVTGLAGVICAEVDMANATIGNGSYCCFEGEINIPASGAGYGTGVPVTFLTGNAWGPGVAAWRTGGYIFNFTGVGSAASGKIFQANTALAATHALRIIIDGVAYYMMLTDQGA